MENTTETVYTFIREYIEVHGFAPSQREIAAGCYISLGAVFNQLSKLEAWGRITREVGQARSITLIEKNGNRNGGEK